MSGVLKTVSYYTFRVHLYLFGNEFVIFSIALIDLLMCTHIFPYVHYSAFYGVCLTRVMLLVPTNSRSVLAKLYS